MLKIGMNQVHPELSWSTIFRLIANPWVDGGIALMAAWLLADLFLLSWADLSYVLPVTALGYAISALLGWSLLSESVSQFRWGGVGLITAGAILVGRTDPRTTPETPEEEASPPC